MPQTESVSDSASLERPSWNGHKRSHGIHHRLTTGKGSKSSTTVALSTPHYSRPTTKPSVAPQPLHQRSQENVIGAHHESDTIFEVRAPYQLQVINIPGSGELENTPGSETEDQVGDASYRTSATHHQQISSVKPRIRITIPQGRHLEIWDPNENDIYVLRGRIMYWDGLVGSHRRDSDMRLYSFRLELRSQYPNMKTLRAVKPRGSASIFLFAEALAGQDDTSPLKGPQIPRAMEPTLILKLRPSRPGAGSQCADFKVILPVGTDLFNGSGNGGVTRCFTIKAEALFKAEAWYSTYSREVESERLELSISVLKKEELMDGQNCHMYLPESERRRRALLQVY